MTLRMTFSHEKGKVALSEAEGFTQFSMRISRASPLQPGLGMTITDETCRSIVLGSPGIHPIESSYSL
jgi:hypothetical protein